MCDISAKNETLEQHWFDVGLASYHAGPTLNQHCFNVPCLLCFAENVSGILFTVLDLFIYINWQRSQLSSDDKPRLFYGFNATRWLGSNLFSYKKYFWFNVTKPMILLDHTDCTVSLHRYVSHVSHCRTCQGQRGCVRNVLQLSSNQQLLKTSSCINRHANSIIIIHWILLDKIVPCMHSFLQPPHLFTNSDWTAYACMMTW